MRIHREGWESLAILSIIFAFIIMVSSWAYPILVIPFLLLYIILISFLLHFFRNPDRPLPLADDSKIYAPADGKVVVIEEVVEEEYIEGPALQGFDIYVSSQRACQSRPHSWFR